MSEKEINTQGEKNSEINLNINPKFLKPYDAGEVEPRIQKLWDKYEYANPDKLPERHRENGKKSGGTFSIVLPPPNVTGILHLGHSAMVTIEDIMVRHARMEGKETLWIPGTDHAAIATQSKVESEIYKKSGERRHDIGREELLRRVNEFAMQSRSTIITQVKAMGASLDWSRLAFTLDEERNNAVNTAFKRMFDDGIIYRGHRIVNWDPKGQTTISDDEIVYKEEKAKLYTFKYSKDFPISISTTRPETKVGDVAVAVNPDDERYKKYIGQTFEVDDFAGVALSIKIVGDREVDPAFGTGALGVTPCHSQIDWEIAERHDLDRTNIVINEYAKMRDGTGIVAGLKTTDARVKIVEWLGQNGLMAKGKEAGEEVIQNLSTAERTGGVVEPLPKLQWFINVNKKFGKAGSKDGVSAEKNGEGETLKEMMIRVVKSGEVKIIPDRFEKSYMHWIENLRDWCISRQIWYGHRIPVWYCLHCNEEVLKNFYDRDGLGVVTNGGGAPNKEFFRSQIDNGETSIPEGFVPIPGCEKVCNKCGGNNTVQDPDTLDTWFSSGLWTFSTLGWPDNWRGKGKSDLDLSRFHPTTVLETGYDILFFWVARMILMSGYLLDEVPFRTVYLHGLVRDAKGQKISKSLGNNIDPLEMIKKYGADALRMSLVVGTGPGNDSKISEDKIKGYRNFANKLWNITRFILSQQLPDFDTNFSKWSTKDAELNTNFTALINEIKKEMNEYKFYLVAEKLYQYAWHELADVILEDTKKVMSEGSEEEKLSRAQFLMKVLDGLLRALHPFMPHVTEEIWGELPWRKDGAEEGKLLMVEGF